MKTRARSAIVMGVAAALLASASISSAGDVGLLMCRRAAKNGYKLQKGQCLSLAKSGQSGTTLAGSKTIDICDNGDGTWTYSGEISIWNEGAVATIGCSITDTVETKNVSGPNWTAVGPAQVISCAEIPAGTTQETALTFLYSVTAPAATTDVRNRAKITITNHSGSVGKPFGPEPKATYTGSIPPPQCADQCGGCTHTIGYWGAKPGNEWPAPYNRDAPFYLDPVNTWGAILPPTNAGSNSSGYYQLARQYIGAVLNQADGACVPSGIQSLLEQAKLFFETTSPLSCSGTGPASCPIQKTWAAILDTYNNGLYPDGPPHCE